MKNEKPSKIDQNILVTADTVVFTVKGGELLILLVKRKSNAKNYPSQWSLPGGIVNEKTDSSTRDTAMKKLEAKTGIKPKFLEQLRSYSGGKRDERKWSVSDAYFILMKYVSEMKDNDQVGENRWVNIKELKEMQKSKPFAFDHALIIEDAIVRLREKTRYSLLPAYCLEELFTLNEFHQAVEIILGHKVQKRSLYRRISESKALKKTDQMRKTDTKNAALYKTNDDTPNYNFQRNLSPEKKMK